MYLANTGWLFFARIINLVTAFLILSIVARYLGPSNYGLLSYAVSFTGLFVFISTLGLDQILYRELIKNPSEHYRYIGTAFYLRLAASFVSFSCAVGTSFLLQHNLITTGIIAVIASAFFFQSFAVINYDFQALVKAKYTSIGGVVVVLALSALKLCVVFFDEGIIYFSAIYLAEGILYMVMFLYCYSKIGRSPKYWVYDHMIAKSMLRDSWPLILTSGLAFVYSRIDQVMINEYLNSTSVGLYDSAVRLAEMWHFIPLLIIHSIFPSIINSKNVGGVLYTQRIKDLLLLLIGISLCFAIPLTLFAEQLMYIVFGSEYVPGSTVLMVYVWAGIGLAVTAAFTQLLIADNKTSALFIVSLFGAVLNILLNLVLIPYLGINGAALSTLISYNATAFLLMGYFYYTFKVKHT
jgi:O-antigen/teichoic acid export membrane protein